MAGLSFLQQASARSERNIVVSEVIHRRRRLLRLRALVASSRFGDEKGTNPEELIAAAHAGCFTMALSAQLTEAGFPPTSLDTRADVDLSMEGGPQLSQIRLKLKAMVPGIDEAKFRELADTAKKNCPVSKALSAVPISLETEFSS